MILEYQAVFSDPSFPPGLCPMGLFSSRSPERPKSAIPNARTVILVFCPSPSYWCCERQQGHCNLRLPVTFISLGNPSFLVSMRSSTECLTVGSSITWVRNLSLRSGCLFLGVLSFLHIPEWFKSSPTRTRPCDFEVAALCL